MLSLGRAIGSPFFTLYEKEENENMNYGNSYNSNPNANPYLSNNIYQTPYSSASPYNNNNTLGTQFSPQNNTQQMTNQVDTMNYVSKEDYDKLIARMSDMNVDKEAIDWYVNLRKYGTCVHSGFGMGFERLIMYLTGIENIRDVIPYPRTPGNCDF